ncbi:hypothetical protein A3H77_00235 [Candidatus Kaiserbacteria bacterium RIFCSPLOWO2_02_FULL_56_11]|uniref:Uncharacterized protein n=2 Tax=Candidatus Kaiseribacteriota TaxID=1752734 RepID=A0A1F6E273_9BACT|nr:MAG: hypothetical protein A3C95_00505 [Candidatus Kaiserbacteria bacterium RIFCSPHIGHO2_02_FULL_56_30]OGG72360.1 MAG: hypothetical protein A3E65_01505 [Candidatus Kaiserbacteria bacterium RIFCSPHIGHO2_12_FULL_56_13]OGG80833.1 MAG: hypothetical protein A3H77_00235 [Candidatus Kaiserbacteria bacterium RIFCSPLOWO2_02_FULL_56_11]
MSTNYLVASFIKNWRILAALLLAGGLVAGAYLTAVSTAHPPLAAASTETELLEAIATKDSDGDGLPDWEEYLYGTDSNKIDTRGLGLPDGEAVARGLIVPEVVVDLPPPSGSQSAVSDLGVPSPAPGSLTAAFARNFFALYLSAKQQKGGALSEEDTAAIAKQAVSQLSGSIATTPEFKTMNDLAVAGTGPEALRAFAALAEAVLTAHTIDAAQSELLYLGDIIHEGDASAIPHLLAIAEGYRKIAAGLSVLPVPQELAGSVLAFVNAMARIGTIASDFARVEGDPLSTMLALSQYPETVLALGNALIEIHDSYRSGGVSFTAGEAGATFVNLILEVAAEQTPLTP